MPSKHKALYKSSQNTSNKKNKPHRLDYLVILVLFMSAWVMSNVEPIVGIALILVTICYEFIVMLKMKWITRYDIPKLLCVIIITIVILSWFGRCLISI